MDAVSLNDFDEVSSYPNIQWADEQEGLNLHEVIFSERDGVRSFAKTAVLKTELSEGDWKVVKVRDKDRNRDKHKVETDVEIKGKLEWGGKDGPQFSGSVSAEAQKDKYYARLEVERDKNGMGSVSGAAGRRGEFDQDD